MIEALVTQRYVRFIVAASALVSGFAISLLLVRQNNFSMGSAIFSIGLAGLVGTGKLASP